MTYTTAPVTPNRTLIVPFNTVTPIDLAAMTAGTFSSITIATQPTNGIVLVRGSVITYTPNPNYFGPDSFTYTATGPGGTSVPGTVQRHRESADRRRWRAAPSAWRSTRRRRSTSPP